MYFGSRSRYYILPVRIVFIIALRWQVQTDAQQASAINISLRHSWRVYSKHRTLTRLYLGFFSFAGFFRKRVNLALLSGGILSSTALVVRFAVYIARVVVGGGRVGV